VFNVCICIYGGDTPPTRHKTVLRARFTRQLKHKAGRTAGPKPAPSPTRQGASFAGNDHHMGIVLDSDGHSKAVDGNGANTADTAMSCRIVARANGVAAYGDGADTGAVPDDDGGDRAERGGHTNFPIKIDNNHGTRLVGGMKALCPPMV